MNFIRILDTTSIVFIEDIPALFVVLAGITYDNYYTHKRLQYIKL
jgi:hypothetical protein